eukprot:TRINITY_DN54394_c0_g1_i1.p1 TRINITY_DN54394_c0_g1~~TRINITY_DN54394_c0_g1_i1.p1  ORF type:complete len:434 (+),score=129.78 TRINITY_DN54394_c0_g1_i1:54-1355(+)
MAAALSDAERAEEEQTLRELAQHLRDLKSTTAGSGHGDAIEGFAAEATKFADLLRDAVSPELAAAVVAKATPKREKWTELLEMLLLASAIENPDGDALKEAEDELRASATQLRTVASSGPSTPVFQAIAAIADEAEQGLADFLAAETGEQKWRVYGRVKESRARWSAQMENMQATYADGSDSQAPTEAPDPNAPACEYADDSSACRFVSTHLASSGCVAWPGDSGGFDSFGGWPSVGCTPVGCTPVRAEGVNASIPEDRAAAAPPLIAADATPEEARKQLIEYIKDEENGLLAETRKAVEKVKADERFEGVHADAAKMLEQLEIGSAAITPEIFTQEAPTDLSGAEERVRACVEGLRKAQWGGFYAKQAAMQVRKYDIYKRKGAMPRLSEEHPDLIECATVAVDMGEFLRKEAQGAILDSVTGLVAQTTRVGA